MIHRRFLRSFSKRIPRTIPKRELQNILGNDTSVRMCASSPTVTTLKGKPHLDV